MSSEWRTLTLGQLGRVVTGKTPKTADPKNFGGKIPFVTPTDMDGCKTMAMTVRYLSELGASTVKSSIIPAGSVMVSCIGSDMGKSVIAKHRCVSNQQINSVVVDAKFSSEFIYYNLSMRKAELQHLASGGSTMPILNKGMFSEVKIDLPPLTEQLAIAKMLAALDDRITLLRETNATLEAIAQALFKSWFVDFDPVRAKMEGRIPDGMDEATAALFSDGFEESELGLVPSGWKPLSVSEVAEIVKGKSYSSKDLVTEHETALVTLKSFARGGGFRLDGFKPYSGIYKGSQVVVSGDLIVAYTDVTQAAELIGKPAIVIGVDEHKTLVASLDVGIIRPLRAQASRQFLYGLFKTGAFQAHTLSHTSGTTVLHLSKDGVGSYRFACPPIAVVEAFSTIGESLTSRQQVNIDQMRNLATIRDTLLPRLISGQLGLPEAISHAQAVMS